jgi:hypothetical protein
VSTIIPSIRRALDNNRILETWAYGPTFQEPGMERASIWSLALSLAFRMPNRSRSRPPTYSLSSI